MRNDWGSQFTGEPVIYQIEFRNTHASETLNNVLIKSDLPENLHVISGTVQLDNQSGSSDLGSSNQVQVSLNKLEPGQGVKITIGTKIKDDVQVDTRIVSQAQATYDGLAAPLNSNVVTVLVVGSNFGPVIQAAATDTATPSATSAPTATATATQSAAPSPTTPPVRGPAGASTNLGAAPLPETSSGVPIFGFALLGFTLLVRTVRIHRAQTRI